ncbi:MAG: hypothetical protein HY038_12810 [Nitrospirae bacterium]|nr:hypothetical protein [Nitrospirota bacterium]
MKEYALAMIAGMWLADGLALLLLPRFVIDHVRTAIQITTALRPWQLSSVFVGTALFWAGLELQYQPLWICAAGGMVCKGIFLAFAPAPRREQLVAWSLGREDVDYRFWGRGLSTLAVLLLHALGWIGQE